jgi:hypothetical protein
MLHKSDDKQRGRILCAGAQYYHIASHNGNDDKTTAATTTFVVNKLLVRLILCRVSNNEQQVLVASAQYYHIASCNGDNNNNTAATTTFFVNKPHKFHFATHCVARWQQQQSNNGNDERQVSTTRPHVQAHFPSCESDNNATIATMAMTTMMNVDKEAMCIASNMDNSTN